MANLIITIISIALVAVAALMGAYYGGTAFIQGQAKAQANKLISNAQQIEAGLRLWQVNNGASTTLPSASMNFLTSQGYLSQVPTANLNNGVPNYACETPSSQRNFSLDSNNCISGAAFAPSRYITAFTGNNTGSADDICKQIAIMASGPSALPAANGIMPAGVKFYCVFYNDSGLGWKFVYELF